MKKIMRGICLAILCAVLLCGALPQNAHATEVDGLVYKITDSAVTITDYTGSATELIIPDTIEGYPVTKIGMSAFSECATLERVTVPDSVVDIAMLGFENCASLKSIRLSANLADISACTFMNCPSLESIVIPESVTAIYSGAFSQCDSLKTAVIPGTVTYIGEGIFYKCAALEHVLFTGTQEQWDAIDIDTNEGEATNKNENLLTVAKHYGAKGDEIQLVDETTCTARILQKCTLCDWAVVDPEYVGSHTYEDGICVVCGDYEYFEHTTNEGVVTITKYTGTDTVLEIPAEIQGKTVATIGEEAFCGNTTITELVIPEGIRSIGARAFAECSALNKIQFEGAAPEGGDNAFESVTATAICPADAGWTEEICALYGGNIKWKVGSTSGVCGESLTWNLSEEGVLTISGSGAMENYDSTEEYQTSTAPWNIWADSITSVVVEEGVTELGTYAFAYCENIKKISLPEQITELPDSVFAGCFGLEEVNIPAGVTSIGNSAFFQCTALEKVTLPEGLTSIGKTAFQWCAITEVTIPGTVTQIGDWAFCDCRSITSITLEEGVTEVAYGMFANASGVTSVSLPSTLKTIANEAFFECSSLTEITVPAGVTSIGEYAFAGCTGVGTITFLGNAPTFGAYAFNDMNMLAIYPANNATWDATAKRYYGGTVLWVTDVKAQGIYGLNIRWVLQGDGTLVVTGSGNIPDFGFSDTPTWSAYGEQIKKIEVMPYIERIGNYAFRGLTNLTSVKMPDTLKSIGEYAFTDCTSLTSVTVPDMVTAIEEGAFAWCESLEEIQLPMFLQTIGRFAFNGCQFTSLTIPGLVQSIGEDPFNYALETISFEGNPPSFNAEAFASFFDKTLVAYYDATNSLWTSSVKQNYGGNVSWAGGKSASGTLSGNVKWKLGYDRTLTIYGSGSMPSYSTSNYAPWASYSNYISKVVVEDGVTCVGDYAFYKLTNLRSVYLGDSVQDIGVAAFAECTYLTEVHMGKSLYLINDKAFYRCESLKELNLPQSMDAIGASAFKECKSLSEVILPEGLTVLYASAFSSCESLTSIVFPASILDIYDYAFAYCSDLDMITFLGDMPDIESCAFDDVSAKAYYPINNSTWPKYISNNYGGSLTWIGDCKGVHSYGDWYKVEAGLERRDCEYCTEYETREVEIVPPEAPVAKVSGVSSTGKIMVSWNKVDGATKYQVYRATSKSGTYSKVKTTTSSSYTDSSAVAGKTYYYKVQAVAEDGTKSEYSSIVSRCCDLPQPVIKVSGVDSSGKNKISWSKIDGAEKYYVYRATSKSGTYTKIKTTTSASYTDTSAKAGKTYYYKVKAIHEDSSANSAYSSVVSRTCDLPRPDVSIKLSSGDPKLSWSKISGAVSYKIYRSTSKSGTYKLIKTTSSTSYTDKSAVAGKTYYYKVVAVHKTTAANSAYSAVDSIKAK